MLRIILGTFAGLVVWTIVVTAINLLMRTTWSDYAAVEQSMIFTLAMMISRLSMSAVSSVISGVVAALISKEQSKAALISGLLIMLLFIPAHISIWAKFPAWYHLTFLLSLPILSVLGGKLARLFKST